MEAMAEVTAGTIEACFEEKDKGIATIRASLEGYRLIEKLFHEEPAENSELSALKALLFERTHLAKVQYDNGHPAIPYGKYLGLCDLIRDAGLKKEYDDWKEEKGYE